MIRAGDQPVALAAARWPRRIFGPLPRRRYHVGVGHHQVGRDHKTRARAIKHPAFGGFQDHDDAHDAAFGVVDAGLRRRRARQRHERAPPPRTLKPLRSSRSPAGHRQSNNRAPSARRQARAPVRAHISVSDSETIAALARRSGCCALPARPLHLASHRGKSIIRRRRGRSAAWNARTVNGSRRAHAPSPSFPASRAGAVLRIVKTCRVKPEDGLIRSVFLSGEGCRRHARQYVRSRCAGSGDRSGDREHAHPRQGPRHRSR